MMRKPTLLMPALVLFLAGCTDNMDSITRELRNANNECMDALTMITTEEQAGRMKTRVFKPLFEGDDGRYKNIEYKLKGWQSNRSNKEIVTETFTSNGFYLYLGELGVNRMRFGMEKTRLRNLYQQYQDREKKRLEDAGEDPFIKNPQQVCPNLHELVKNDTMFKNIESQLMQPKLFEIVKNFPTMKGVENYAELHKIFVQKSEIILKMKPPDLVR